MDAESADVLHEPSAYTSTSREKPSLENSNAEKGLQREQEQESRVLLGATIVRPEAEPRIPGMIGNESDEVDPNVNEHQSQAVMSDKLPNLGDACENTALQIGHEAAGITYPKKSISNILVQTQDVNDVVADATAVPNTSASSINELFERTSTYEHSSISKSTPTTQIGEDGDHTSSQQGLTSISKEEKSYESDVYEYHDAAIKSRNIQLLTEKEESLRSTVAPELPKKQSLEELIQTEKMNAYAEFELDSSPIQSSSSDTSSISSSSDDSSDDDYEMLDPAEQARRLMQEDGGSDDDDGTGKRKKATFGPLRTLNEKPDEIVKKPNVIVTRDMKIEELGVVENLIENLVLVKGKTSGEHQVLEFGSVLCLENRVVIGAIAETLGRVQEPYYSVCFTNAAAISEVGISRGTKIFFVEQYSRTVFTQPLKAFKGSDASNLHDEEVGDDEIEFSDDEAEAEHKRKLKIAKQVKREARQAPTSSLTQGPWQISNQERRNVETRVEDHTHTSATEYDNSNEGDDLYTPLTRPSNLHEIMGPGEAPLEDQIARYRPNADHRGRARDRRRGRVDRAHMDIHRRRGKGQKGNQGSHAALGRSAIDPPNGDQEHHRSVMQQHGSNGISAQNHGSQYPSQNFKSDPVPPTNIGLPAYSPASAYSRGPPTQAFPSFIHPSHAGQYPNQHPYQPPYHSNPIDYTAQLQPQQNYQSDQNQTQYLYSTQQYPHQQRQFQDVTNPRHNAHSFPSPTPPALTIPPGTHINPAFFPMATQNPVVRQTDPHRSLAFPGGSISPTSEIAFRAAQDRLDVLKNLPR